MLHPDDRPTRAEAERDEAPDLSECPYCGETAWMDTDDGNLCLDCHAEERQPEPERACWICDGLGHGWVTGWEGGRPILSSPCPLEDRGSYDPRDDDPF